MCGEVEIKIDAAIEQVNTTDLYKLANIFVDLCICAKNNTRIACCMLG